MTEPALATEAESSQTALGTEPGSEPGKAQQQQGEGGDGKPTQGSGDPPPSGEQPPPEGGDKGKKGEGAGGEVTPPAPEPKAPESYEFKATKDVPDSSLADKTTTEQWAKLAKEHDLTQEQAQNGLDLMTREGVRQRAEFEAQTHKQWVDSSHADKEIGGENRKEAVERAKTVLKDDRIATPALRELLNGPLGDHPEVIRVFNRVGKFLSSSAEDTVVTAGAGGEDPSDEAAIAAKFYPKSKQQQ